MNFLQVEAVAMFMQLGKIQLGDYFFGDGGEAMKQVNIYKAPNNAETSPKMTVCLQVNQMI